MIICGTGINKMKEKLPINNKILKWARTTVGLSIKDVAQKMKKTEDDILSWESGEKSPTYVQLEKLAYEIYKRPVVLFFFPEVPEEDNPKTEFRTIPEEKVDDLPYEIIKVYRRAKIFQFNLEELYEGKNITNPNFLEKFYITDNTNIKKLCKDIRNYLNISFQIQTTWKNYDDAFKEWRKALQDKGIFIFKDAFKNDNYSGFCLYDIKYPIIYINNTMPFSRQIFTIFHELGHLLLHSGGIDFRDKSITNTFDSKYLEYERLCNQISNEILVPSEYFDKEKFQLSENHFEYLAKKYCVSREVILRNFLERGFVNNNDYNELSNKWIEEAKQYHNKKGGGNYYLTQKSYLGDKYIELTFNKYYQNKISIKDLSEFLNMKEKNIIDFEQIAI